MSNRDFIKSKILEYSEKTNISEKKLGEFLKFIGFKRFTTIAMSNFLVGMGQFKPLVLKFAIYNFMNDKDKYRKFTKNRKITIFTKYLVSLNYADDLHEELDDEIEQCTLYHNKNFEDIENEEFDHELRKLEDEFY